MLTEAMLRKLWPHGDSRIPGLIQGIVAAADRGVFAKHGLTTPSVIAIAMAQFSHECGAGTEVEENLNFSAEGLVQTWPKHFDATTAKAYAHNPKKLANFVYEPPIHKDLGNLAGTDDGWNLRGRCGSQVTGRNGYARVGQKLGLDLLSHPELVNDPEWFLECSIVDFILCGCLPFAEQGDFVRVTEKLNGGLNGLGKRRAWLPKWQAALAAAGHDVPGAPPAAPEDRLSEFEIRAIQDRLRELQYFGVGLSDGKWGSRVIGAVSAFQADNGLPVNGHYDEATREELAKAEPRSIDPARAKATAQDLAAMGSPTVVTARAGKIIGVCKMLGGGLLLGGSAATHVDLIDVAQHTVDKATQVKTIYQSAHDLLVPLFSHPGVGVIAGALLVGGYLVYRNFDRIERICVRDHQTGANLGLRGQS